MKIEDLHHFYNLLKYLLIIKVFYPAFLWKRPFWFFKIFVLCFHLILATFSLEYFLEKFNLPGWLIKFPLFAFTKYKFQEGRLVKRNC